MVSSETGRKYISEKIDFLQFSSRLSLLVIRFVYLSCWGQAFLSSCIIRIGKWNGYPVWNCRLNDRSSLSSVLNQVRECGVSLIRSISSATICLTRSLCDNSWHQSAAAWYRYPACQ